MHIWYTCGLWLCSLIAAHSVLFVGRVRSPQATDATAYATDIWHFTWRGVHMPQRMELGVCSFVVPSEAPLLVMNRDCVLALPSCAVGQNWTLQGSVPLSQSRLYWTRLWRFQWDALICEGARTWFQLRVVCGEDTFYLHHAVASAEFVYTLHWRWMLEDLQLEIHTDGVLSLTIPLGVTLHSSLQNCVLNSVGDGVWFLKSLHYSDEAYDTQTPWDWAMDSSLCKLTPSVSWTVSVPWTRLDDGATRLTLTTVQLASCLTAQYTPLPYHKWWGVVRVVADEISEWGYSLSTTTNDAALRGVLPQPVVTHLS
jgi:hypothetical protein